MLLIKIIRLIADKMRSLLFAKKQNIGGNWRRLHSLTIYQKLEKILTSKATLFGNIQRLHRRLRNAKFYFQFRLHNLLKTIYDFLQ